jgi:hypothetical protein
MIRIIRTSTERQLHAGMDELHSRWVSERTRAHAADHRITLALAILDGQDTALAQRLRAVLTGEQL